MVITFFLVITCIMKFSYYWLLAYLLDKIFQVISQLFFFFFLSFFLSFFFSFFFLGNTYLLQCTTHKILAHITWLRFPCERGTKIICLWLFYLRTLSGYRQYILLTDRLHRIYFLNQYKQKKKNVRKENYLAMGLLPPLSHFIHGWDFV